jgi:hypothetical protein
MKVTLEKHFQSNLTEWIQKPDNKMNCAYELKISYGNTVNFNDFQEQQIPSLWATRHDGKAIKWSDALANLKPYDGAYLMGIPAYVGIMFNIPTNQKDFYFIDIDRVLKIKQNGAKSITKKDCERWGIKKSF